MADYWQGLNPEQKQAVATLDGPLLVLAGAGTGKTGVLTARLAHLLDSGRCAPWQALAVTFTNKAAGEMRRRLEVFIGSEVKDVPLGTFHAICARILRRHAQHLGLKSDFSILDADDQLRLVKELMAEDNLDIRQHPPRMLITFIERWKNRALLPDQLSQEDKDGSSKQAARLYARYQDRLCALNACDFSGLLLQCLLLLQHNPEILAQYHRRWRFISVDEYQDSNTVQYLWLRLLAQAEENLCCVGDDDQSIYGWRGAEIGNILRFESDFPKAQIIRLERNYRSNGNILKAASKLIAHNQGRIGKTLWTQDQAGPPLRLHGLWDAEAEAAMIAQHITHFLAPPVSAQKKAQPQAISADQIAILVRMGAQTRVIEESLIAAGVAYRMIGSLRFYERLEIRDAVAYFRLACFAHDDLALMRIINQPRRGVGAKTLELLKQEARNRAQPLFAVLPLLLKEGLLKGAAARALESFYAQVSHWQAQATTLSAQELAHLCLTQSGYRNLWSGDSLEARGRNDNLEELLRATGSFPHLPDFLEHLVLNASIESNEPSGPMVSLMTLHAAKGLEFDSVFLPGWEEGLLPSMRALDEGGKTALEEERRLAYVGLTRARRQVVLSFAASRFYHGARQVALPSRFLKELPAEVLQIESEHGIALPGAFDPARTQGSAPRHTYDQAQTFTDAYDQPPVRRPARSSPSSAHWQEQLSQAVAQRRQQIAKGQRVHHQKFGLGVVRAIEKDLATVAFDDGNARALLMSYLKPAAPPEETPPHKLPNPQPTPRE